MDITLSLIAGLVAVANFLVWGSIMLLPWKPWNTSEELDALPDLGHEDLSHVTVLIPARNEEKTIGKVLASVMEQGRSINIIVVDDQSGDNTAEIARTTCGDAVRIIRGLDLPRGWTGKLWALDQGLKHVNTRYTLLLDADIVLSRGIAATAVKAMEQYGLNMLSLLACMSMKGFWERLTMPAFVYFFKMIYPFKLANFPKSRVAAAAGGFIMVETDALRKINAFESIKNELIDDCALAGKLKAAGFRTWLGLTHSVKSIRRYRKLADVWDMVARTAFTQLRHSFFLLLAVTAIMLVMFPGLAAGFFTESITLGILSWVSMTFMLFTYIKVLAYYGIPFYWALSLPFTAMLYLMMTWSSALHSWRGRGARWKQRFYN